jgi:3-carboxy-cis,cis-muconate cycloisomerase
VFAAIFVPAELREAVSDRAWLQAMLDAERALAVAEARAGLFPEDAAEAIAAWCHAELYDADEIAERGRTVGNPAEPLVRALTRKVGAEVGRYVHRGATSQDVLDTAAMLVSRRALDLILAELAGVLAGCAALAEAHRSTPLAARTLLQHALPTTFGLKAAGWLVAVLDARRRLADLQAHGLAAELGGAAGTLAALAEHGPAVLRLYAEELDLAEPVVPWHTNRVRVAELGGALDVAAGTLAKIGLDVALLAQTEVAEVREPEGGGSSTLPHKRNPVRSTLARACARQVHAHAAVLSGGLAQEHERAIGDWQAEWSALSGALALTGGAAASARRVVEGLEVDVERMGRNLDATRGLIMAERVAGLLADELGRLEAHDLVGAASARASAAGRALRDELLDDPRIDLSEDELDAAFDPATYLGSAETFVDRALELYGRELDA